MSDAPATFDARDLRNAFGRFATGVTIVTTRGHDGTDVGLTVNSFSSVSLNPPMILWSLAKTSSIMDAFRDAGYFAVHVLAADQEALSARFAAKTPDRFENVGVERGAGDIPLLRDCTARFACRTAFQHEGGDHTIFVGEVLEFTHSERAPLVFHGGRYGMVLRKEGPPAIAAAPSVSPSPDDLIYHISQAYYDIRRNATQERQRRGWSEHEYIAMTVLGWKDGCRICEIDEFTQARGWQVTPEIVTGLAARGLVKVTEPAAMDSKVRLTEAGRRAIIELIAILKASEAEALEGFDPSETQMLGQLLRRLTSSRSPGLAAG